MSTPKRAILFLNLGGPETLADVKMFLYRLFADPEILRIKFTPLRKLAAWLIATSREKKSRGLYASIGGGSPIKKLTDQQSLGVEKILRGQGKEVIVRTAFTCSDPLVEDVIFDLSHMGVTQFLAFPLYPQYSMTTTKGSLERVRKAVRLMTPRARLTEVRSWPEHLYFVDAHVEMIKEEVSKFTDPADKNIHIIFSAHSIPESYVTKLGDPYKTETEQSVNAILRRMGWKGGATLAWQSKLGPVKWLEPSTEQVIHQLAKEGVKQVLVVPISFVTDHIETLNEIDLQFKEEALQVGIREFRRTMGLNDRPTFLKALADIALSKAEFWEN